MEQARYTQLVALEKRLDLIQERAEARQDEEHDYSKHLISLFQDICKIVRDADNSDASNLDAIVEKAAKLMDRGIYLGYDGAGMFDFMPSFAHESKEVLIEDSYKGSISVF